MAATSGIRFDAKTGTLTVGTRRYSVDPKTNAVRPIDPARVKARKVKLRQVAPVVLELIQRAGGCSFFLPLRTKNRDNSPEHWTLVYRRSRRERRFIRSIWPCVRPHAPALPVDVEMVRLYTHPRHRLDEDGLGSALKSVRDEIAAQFGVDDADPRISFRPAQQLAKKGGGVWVHLLHRSSDTRPGGS